MSDLKNVQRIYNNIHVLLGRGLFPGEGAEALHESQKFVAEMIQKIEKDLSNEQATEQAGSSNRDEADAGRVVGGDVPNPGRKSRKRKAD